MKKDPASDLDVWATVPQMSLRFNNKEPSTMLVWGNLGGRFASESHVA